MAGGPMAARRKKARRQGAYLAVIDGSGLPMAPPVRRTWASRGQTPESAQRCGEREKVSVAAAVWPSPRRDRPGLFARRLVDDHFDNRSSAASLEALLRGLPGRVVVVWGGGGMPQGDPIHQLQGLMAGRPGTGRLPPYSPRISPVEPSWSWLKYSRLCSYAPHDATDLVRHVVAALSALRDDQDLLRGSWHASDLPLTRPLTLLS